VRARGTDRQRRETSHFCGSASDRSAASQPIRKVAACAPFLYSADSSMVISYDDPESLALKMKYLKDKGLRGVMFWEWHGDDGGELLATLANWLTPFANWLG